MALLSTVLCHHCEGAGLDLQPGGHVVCRYCGTTNVLDGVVCPHCEYVNLPGAQTCVNCRQALVRACPQCRTANWAGAETCQACGASLDAVATLSNRLGLDPAERLNAQQRSARSLKEQEALDAERRLAGLNAMEARRQANLRAAQQKKAEEQRVLYIGTAVVVLVIVAAVAVSLLLSALR
jgi:hypothetical protein